jgi:hypothetical protein
MREIPEVTKAKEIVTRGADGMCRRVRRRYVGARRPFGASFPCLHPQSQHEYAIANTRLRHGARREWTSLSIGNLAHTSSFGRLRQAGLTKDQTYMSDTPRFGAWQDLATEVTEITEGGGLVFYARCALCALWLNPDLGVPGI